MKKSICIYIISLIWALTNIVVCQENKTKTENKPVKHTFEHSMLINNQTIKTFKKNSLQFGIQHRFGRINQGFEEGKNFDLFGILGTANIRVGVNYSITDKMSLGLGATKNNYLYDIQWKYKVLQQTKSNAIPITIVYFGNTSVKTVKEDDLIFVNRLSYFHQLLIARKFNSRLSLQVAPLISYFNLVDTIGEKDAKHINFGSSFSGRFNVSPQGSIILEYNQPFTVSDFSNDLKTLPDVGIGFEIATKGHIFQFFITSAISIINQYNMVENTNNFAEGEVFLGFNISRNWNF